MLERLKEICAAREGRSSPTARSSLVVRQAEGGMRDALSLLDQVLSACGPTPTDAAVAEALGAIDRTVVQAVRRGAGAPRREGAARRAWRRSSTAAWTSSGSPRSSRSQLRHVFVAKATGEAPAELAESEQKAVVDARAGGGRRPAGAALRRRARLRSGTSARAAAAPAGAGDGAAQGDPARARRLHPRAARPGGEAPRPGAAQDPRAVQRSLPGRREVAPAPRTFRA